MRRPFLIGLTGSIGMGKSTAAAMFAEMGVPVWDADAAVRDLYGEGGAGVAAIARLHPDAIVGGAVDRECLKRWIAQEATALRRIERAIHPLVARDRARFAADLDDGIACLDIPLLYETGMEDQVDMVVVVSAPPGLQRRRVLARPGMNEEAFAALLDKQMPDAEKRQRADAVIPAIDHEGTRAAIAALLERIRKERDHA